MSSRFLIRLLIINRKALSWLLLLSYNAQTMKMGKDYERQTSEGENSKVKPVYLRSILDNCSFIDNRLLGIHGRSCSTRLCPSCARIGSWTLCPAKGRLQHGLRVTYVVRVAHISAAAGIARTEIGTFPILVQSAGVFRINEPRILLPYQFLHHRKHIDLAFVEKHFRVVLVRLAHTHIPEMHMIDAIAGSEIAADFHGILAHLARDSAIEGDAVRGAGHDGDQPLPPFHRPHDLPRPTAQRSGGRWMQRQPHAGLHRHRNHRLQEVGDVVRHSNT